MSQNKKSLNIFILGIFYEMIKVFNKVLKSICRYRENITIDEMIEIIKNNENVVLLDVRSSQEFKEGHIRRKH